MWKERNTSLPLHIGMCAHTPFSPSGLVEVLVIENLHPIMLRETVLVRYLDRHPHGYPAGTLGRYFHDELQPIGPDAVRGPIGTFLPPRPPHGESDGIPGCP
jgi:hypothetical protein